jgi:hypothetical protein
MVGVCVKVFINIYKKLCQSNIPLEFSFTPLPASPTFRIQIENTIMKFGQLINSTMQGEIMFNLSDPSHVMQAINFIDLNSGKIRDMMKGVGMKGHSMGGVNII